MEYYAVQVWTGKEDDFVARMSADPRLKARVILPKRAVAIRRGGKEMKQERPLFAGYVFIAVESAELEANQRWILRSSNFFLRMLPSTREPKPVQDKDRRLLAHFMSFGKVADISKVTFDENDRIVVLDGPLKGLEGLIVKVDKRKGRAKIRLDMCENSFLVDMGFEILDRSVKGSSSDDGTHTREP